jgi:DNA-binding MarR family transcriptional regulator
MVDISAERQYAEEAALTLEGMGLTRAYGKVLGWLLICEPPAQTGTEIAAALQISKGSVSAGLRVLEGVRLIRRVAVPGRRGSFYEMDPHAFMAAAASPKLAIFRELMEKGLAVVGGEDAPGAERLRMTRDFYAFMEREIPLLLDRFTAEYEPQREGQSGG